MIRSPVHSCFECGCTLRSLHYRLFINGTLRRFCLRDYRERMSHLEDA